MTPAAGLRVLDLGSFITAPYAAMLLAELGADVVKVERPDGGDPFRRFGDGLYSPQFQGHNRGKRSLALDITRPEGRDALLEMAALADVVVMNFRPGVPDRLGIGWAALHACNPRLVVCEITGFGPDGPYARRPAYDTVGQAVGGMASVMREPGDPRIAGPALADAATGLFACYGILGALLERAATGHGRHVEVNMVDATIALMNDPVCSHAATGEPARTYTRAAYSQSFVLACADGKALGLHLSSPEKFWRALLTAIERLDLGEDARFRNRMARVRHYGALADLLADVFRGRTRAAWMLRLEAQDVPFAPVNAIEDLRTDPQVAHLGTLYDLHHPMMGRVGAVRRPVWFDGSRELDLLPPPLLGEHSAAVLADYGLAERIGTLCAAGALGEG